MGWVKPNNFHDPDSAWNSEANAYDGNLLTSANNESGDAGWQPFLRLLLPGFPAQGIPCTKVRVHLDSDDADQVDIDVYYFNGGQGYIDVYEGAFAHNEWIELEIPGGVYPIIEMRVRFYDTDEDNGGNEINEAEFWEVFTRPLVGSPAASSGLVGKGLAR